MTKEEILERVIERIKDNEYDYEIETFLKRKEVNPDEFKSIIETARAQVLEERLKTMPKKNQTVFTVLVVLIIATIYLFAFYLPNTNVSQNKTFLSILGTAAFCFVSFLAIAYYGTWKPEFLKIRDKPRIDFTLMTLMLIPGVIVYFIFSECFSNFFTRWCDPANAVAMFFVSFKSNFFLAIFLKLCKYVLAAINKLHIFSISE